MEYKLLTILSAITDEENMLLSDAGINRDLYMKSNNNIINSEKLLSEGKLITVRPHTRFVHFPEHTHDYIEVVYMCKGKTVHIVNNEIINLKQGELLFLSQNAKQEIFPASQDDIAVNFIILPEFFDRTFMMLQNENTPLKQFVTECLINEHSSIPYLHFKVSDILPIQNLVENLIWTLINNITNKRVVNQTTMSLLILQLMNFTDKLEFVKTEDEIVMRTLSYIEEHYKRGSLRELSNELHYDFAQLSREIKSRTGKTYTELVQQKRMSQAAYLLRNTNINVDEIALKIGYENISYFHRLFLKKYGVTPKKYRSEK